MKRKAFTLVELLVVIAILAILATVSIIGGKSFVDKAHLSNDLTLLTQMNLVLKGNEAFDREHSMKSAIHQVEENGVEYERIMPETSQIRLAYDSYNNRFAFLDTKYNVVLEDGDKPLNSIKANVFVIVNNTKEIVDSDGYSVYLNNGFTGTKINITAGIDVGNNTGIEQITFVKKNTISADIVITTASSSCNVYIYSTIDKINHYGECNDVYVVKTANGYYEYGTVNDIFVTASNVTVCSSANVNHITNSDYNKVTGVNIGVLEKSLNNEILILGGNVTSIDD